MFIFHLLFMLRSFTAKSEMNESSVEILIVLLFLFWNKLISPMFVW